MSLSTGVLSKLFRRSSSLSELELHILGVVRARLPVSLTSQWDEQVRAINKVQRLPDGVEVNFYRMQGGKPTFDRALAFPNQTEELLLVVVRLELHLTGESAKLAARVWCIRGFLFSIEYDGSSRYFEEGLGMDPAPSVSISCELVADLAAQA